jgi:hypothetical protein
MLRAGGSACESLSVVICVHLWLTFLVMATSVPVAMKGARQP